MSTYRVHAFRFQRVGLSKIKLPPFTNKMEESEGPRILGQLRNPLTWSTIFHTTY